MRKAAENTLVRENLRLVKQLYPTLAQRGLRSLRDLTRAHGLSVLRGEILCIDGKWYVTHAGLLQIALRARCVGIQTVLQERQSDPLARRWVFRATVFKSHPSKGFVGYGDADPSNTSALVRGSEMRIAETRAVNRALRKAYGIGLCSVEELGWPSSPSGSSNDHPWPSKYGASNDSNNGHPRLRDKLCLVIRRYELDSNLVKRYAADFCGTETLRDASRDLVESFVSTISQEAANNRAALVCKLSSYNQPEEVRP